MRNISVANYFLDAVLCKAQARGLNTEKMLSTAGVSPELLSQSNARVSAVNFGRLQSLVMRELGDEFLGYGPSRYVIGTWTNMCHSVIHCATLGHVAARYCRFYQMFEWGLQPHFEMSGDCARVVISPGNTDKPIDLYGYELIMFNVHRFLSWMVRQHLPLIAVNLSYPPPEHAQEYRHLFLGQAVFFNQPRTEIVFHRSLTDLPVEQTAQSLQRFLQHPSLVMLVQQYKEKSWTAQIRMIVNKHLIDTPGIETIAQQLHLHPQTLRRRLAQEGTTFNEVKTQCRYDTALYHLGRSNISIESIAQRTGFSEPSAFIRAFKNWTGMTPQHYRRRM
ncbi:putative HTH-type transcriptional regulator [Zhongshania aliphaticivorans]|uniref:Putative HTH-type transcriptional regulator n=2 Tax=Zhongshania aliphaticivorans TaxID=1470434 RepID=A0A5S9P3B2_9GAMM|nr:putative HTH-type transcriptional regulator [Zhongshania aliphaticivorans]CAA0097585.1 putative HTH-type transcriptional regulator [Zhongshania aliphaticivorans]